MVENNVNELLKRVYREDLTIEFKVSDVFILDKDDPFQVDQEIKVSMNHFKAMTFEIMKDFADTTTSNIKMFETEAMAFLKSFNNFHTWNIDNQEVDLSRSNFNIKHGYYRLAVLYLQKLEQEIKKK